MKKQAEVGDRLTLHELGKVCGFADFSFKTINGRVEYDSISYPRRCSGWWVRVGRMTPSGFISRNIHTDTVVEITEIRDASKFLMEIKTT